ncbi:hypothetical protein QT986_19045 [Microcoleus sp. herbarium14]
MLSIDVGTIGNGSRNGTIARNLGDRKVEVLVWIFDTILSWARRCEVDRPFTRHHLRQRLRERGLRYALKPCRY